MAIQKGIIKLVGTIDGINFYMRKGVPVARKAGGGFSTKAIKHSPKMKRVRENSTEFGHCSQIKRILKQSFTVLLQDYKDPSLHARMMRLLQEIKVLDVVSERGKRTVPKGLQTDLGKQLFCNFRFTEKYRIDTLQNSTVFINPTDFSCSLLGFDVKNLSFPTGATHVKLSYLVVSYDFEQLSFVTTESSLFIEPDFRTDSPILFSPDLSLHDLNTVICYFGVRFYQQVGTEKYILKSTTAIGLQCVHIAF